MYSCHNPNSCLLDKVYSILIYLDIYPISTVYLGGGWSQTSLFELVEPIFVLSSGVYPAANVVDMLPSCNRRIQMKI